MGGVSLFSPFVMVDADLKKPQESAQQAEPPGQCPQELLLCRRTSSATLESVAEGGDRSVWVMTTQWNLLLWGHFLLKDFFF